MSINSTLLTIMSSEDGVYQIFSLCHAKARPRRVHENFVFRDLHDGPMPVDYNLWIVALLRWIVFSHVLDNLTILGMGVVTASGVMIALKSRYPELRFSSSVLANVWSPLQIVTKIRLFMKKNDNHLW